MPFVIVALPRTGSTHLVALLNSQKNIVCYTELLQERLRKPLSSWRERDNLPESVPELMELRERDPRGLVIRLFSEDRPDRVVGFKIFRGQSTEALDYLVETSEVKKVVLFRRNVLAAFSSSRIARSVGERQKPTSELQPVITFVPEQFSRYCTSYLRFYEKIIDRLNATNQSYFLINYEDINNSTIFSSLVAFLVKRKGKSSARSTMVKLNSPDILTRFSNPDTVLDFLCQNRLQHWLYEAELSFDHFSEYPRRMTRRRTRLARDHRQSTQLADAAV